MSHVVIIPLNSNLAAGKPGMVHDSDGQPREKCSYYQSDRNTFQGVLSVREELTKNKLACPVALWLVLQTATQSVI